eukprot:CAMPEP_0197072062 /NCGR_PEP_ID=MMETSP1384-20130603/209906_1 /TAXON_ID=29189 /ORGANISM="Ammonia sp." /LENGTH=529 /DNA_ID=CAMNT_0042510875 /DNA_START=63 /DNA_END=1653 /DNA_ORIENTATION=-
MATRKARTGLRSTRSTARTRASGDTEKDALMNEDNYLQSEYITNLQQQIYFLELELQVMKEKQASGRFAGKALSSNVPLDTHMNSLRDKYMSMEKKFKKKIRKMEEDGESLTKKSEEQSMQLLDATNLNRELADKVEAYEKEREASSNSHLADRLKFENRIEKLNGKLSEKNSLYESISDKYREFRVEANSEIDGLKDNVRNLKKEIDEIKKQMAAMEEAKKRAEIELIECQEAVTVNTETMSTLKNENFNQRDEIRAWEHKYKKLEIHGNNVDIEEENFNQRDEIRAWEHKYKKLEMDLEQERAVSAKYERENQNLRKQMMELEEEIKAEQKKVADANKTEDRWSARIVELRHELELKANQMKALTERLKEAQAEKQQYTEDSYRQKEQINDSVDKLSQCNELLNASNKSLKKLEDLNLELKKDNIIKTDIVDKFDAEREHLQKEVSRFKQENQSLAAECHTLRQKLNIANKLENINLDEFKTLCSTNLRVADSIKTLMSTINKDAPNAASASLQQNDAAENQDIANL